MQTTDETTDETTEATEPASDQRPRRRPSRAERLEAKAAKLREAEERRAEAQQTDTDRSPRRSRGLLIATAVSATVAVALAAVLVVLFLSWQHRKDVDNARASALQAAQRYAVDFGSYDYQHLQADFQRVASHLTPSFAATYRTSSAKLAPTIVQYHGRSTATVRGAGVTSGGTSEVTVVVFLDQKVTTSQSSTPRIDRNRLLLQLVRRNGTWLIAKVTPE